MNTLLEVSRSLLAAHVNRTGLALVSSDHVQECVRLAQVLIREVGDYPSAVEQSVINTNLALLESMSSKIEKLSTPHRCVDCLYCEPVKETVMCRYFKCAAGELNNIHLEWLCGHWQEKGKV